MSEIKVNKISPRTACGTTGDSGDTIAIGAGVTTSGMGRTSTVDWQTSSIKTSTFTATDGEGYFANTSGGAFTMNLPAGSAGNYDFSSGLYKYFSNKRFNCCTKWFSKNRWCCR